MRFKTLISKHRDCKGNVQFVVFEDLKNDGDYKPFLSEIPLLFSKDITIHHLPYFKEHKKEDYELIEVKFK